MIVISNILGLVVGFWCGSVANVQKVWAEGTALKHANRAKRTELCHTQGHHPCAACGRVKPDYELAELELKEA